MATSFISEHSAEYILVPNLATILLNSFKKVIPIYFASREGSNNSISCDNGLPMRVLAMLGSRKSQRQPPHN